jgi:hypothetical protein
MADDNPDRAAVLSRARAAGLKKAVQQFPEDVVAGYAAAEHARSAFAPPERPVTEPWPAMRVRGTP